MVLSRFELDTARRSTMCALASPSLFHGAIESSFPGERQRRLWRIDPLGGRLYLLLLSGETPPADDAPAQFGIPGAQWESRDYTPLLNALRPGGVWRFRLCANPTVSRKKGDDDSRGSVMPHITPDYQKLWLAERADKHGFSLDEDAFDVVSERRYSFRKGGGSRPVQLLSVAYEGLLTVRDPDLMRETLTTGIGRGKAYGQGLLTLAPPRSSGFRTDGGEG